MYFKMDFRRLLILYLERQRVFFGTQMTQMYFKMDFRRLLILYLERHCVFFWNADNADTF